MKTLILKSVIFFILCINLSFESFSTTVLIVNNGNIVGGTLDTSGKFSYGTFSANSQVKISCFTPDTGYVFNHWTETVYITNYGSLNWTLDSAYNTTAMVSIPDLSDDNTDTITLTAIYYNYGYFELTIENLNGGIIPTSDGNTIPDTIGSYHFGDTVKLNLNMGLTGVSYIGTTKWITFNKWVAIDPISGDTLNVSEVNIAEPDSGNTYLIMPAKNITVEATFVDSFEFMLYGGIILTQGKGKNHNYFTPGQKVFFEEDSGVKLPFGNWSGSYEYMPLFYDGAPFVADIYSPKTYLIMPSVNIFLSGELREVYDFELVILNGSPEDSFWIGGDTVNISADLPEDSYFVNWRWANDTISIPLSNYVHNVDSPNTYVILPDMDMEIEAVFAYTLTVENGSGSGTYEAGDTVNFETNTPLVGLIFDKWIAIDFITGDTLISTEVKIAEPDSNSTYLIMPTRSIIVVASYTVKKYTLTVIDGTGSGNYIVGERVEIIADAFPSGTIFKKWNGFNFYSLVNDSLADTTYITMTSADITVEAVYTCGCGENLNQLTGNKISIYPNPAKDKITIENFDVFNSNLIEICDISGRVALNQTLQNSTIDISNLVPGVYIVKVSTASGIFISKLIKE